MSDRAAPLVATGLTKRYGNVTALDAVDLSLEPGELVALVGPSGCGKSTLLRSIAGLVALDAGTVQLDGELVDDGRVRLPPERRSIGLVFQDHSLFAHLTVEENVAFGIRNVSKRAVAERTAEMLDLVTLGDHGARYPHELSGGERQRVALARALAPRPALMLFDEPFANLDHNRRVRLRHQVIAALRATATPAVFVTHDQDEALAIGDRIAVMRAGRIRQLDRPAAVFHTPVDRFVAAFMGDASFLPIAETAAGPATALGALGTVSPLPAGASAMVRPDDLRFDRSADGEAEITAAEYHGIGWLLTVKHPAGPELLVAASHLNAPLVGERGTVHLVEGHRQMVVPGDPS